LGTPTALLAKVQALRVTGTNATAAPAVETAIEGPARDPFRANETWFPKPKSELKSQASGGLKDAGAKDSGPEAGTIGASEVSLLEVEGTLLGSERMAIVRGNSVRVDGRFLVLVTVEAGKGPEAERVKAVSADGGRRLRVGDELTVRATGTASDGRYRLTEPSEALRVKEITHRGLVLTLGDKEYLLEMGK